MQRDPAPEQDSVQMPSLTPTAQPPSQKESVQLPPLRSYLGGLVHQTQDASPSFRPVPAAPAQELAHVPRLIPRGAPHETLIPSYPERSYHGDRRQNEHREILAYPETELTPHALHARIPSPRSHRESDDWVASPTRVGRGFPGAPGSATYSHIPLQHDLHSRSYSGASSSATEHYPPIALSVEARGYPVERTFGENQVSPSDPAAKYFWEGHAAESAANSASNTGLANPNGRKRRGNLPKESTHVLNEW
ncbi:MAG: hypothetical protein Q9159_004646 [Coniocarpon cinnabarinum]